MSNYKEKELNILVAEDDVISRKLVKSSLQKWGYNVTAVKDGNEAWAEVKSGTPHIAIIDWMMPEMNGIELCKKIRNKKYEFYTYIIILTSLSELDNIVDGLDAGADDYMTKPYNLRELRARIKVGLRVINLEKTLNDHVKRLEDALNKVEVLQGLLPICAYCKKVRDDKNYWEQVESYISKHSDVRFSHGICPECYEKYIKPQLMEAEKEHKQRKLV